MCPLLNLLLNEEYDEELLEVISPTFTFYGVS